MKNLLYDVFEYKITSLLVAVLGSKVFTTTISAIMGSRVLQAFFDQTDWAYMVFGIGGFAIMYSTREIRGIQESNKSLRFWMARVFLSVTLPVLITQIVMGWVSGIDPDHSYYIALIIGMIPEFFVLMIIDKANKKINDGQE